MKNMKFKNKKFLMLGIGGIGVSALARLLKSFGAQISGYDDHDSNFLNELKKENINILNKKDIDVKNYDYLIYTNAIPKTDSLIVLAEKFNIPVYRRGEVLSQILSSTNSIAVTGSHGKTTTTFIIGNLVHASGLKPTVYGGGIDINQKTNLILGDGNLLIAEMDESDKTFVSAKPKITILTNLEHEHVDQYPTFDSELEAFNEYFIDLPKNSTVVINGDDQKLLTHLSDSFKNKKIILCGKNKNNEYILKTVQETQNGIKINISHKTNNYEFKSNLYGYHNAYNMLYSIAACHELGLNDEQIQVGFNQFKGVKRRFELLKKLKNDGDLITDYGHHPTEINAVIKAARNKSPNKKIIAVFEAHRFSRLTTLFSEFVNVLKTSDKVLTVDVHTAGETGDQQKILNELKNKLNPIECVYIPTKDVLNHILTEYTNGEIVILFTAGELDYVVRAQL